MTADYIAKKHGVKTEKALWKAKQVYPEINFISNRMDLNAERVEISVRDNEFISFAKQRKIDRATSVPKEITEEAYRFLKKNYD